MIKFPVKSQYFRVLEYRGFYYPQQLVGQNWAVLTHTGSNIPMVDNDLVTLLKLVAMTSVETHIQLTCQHAIERLEATC
jgi:hypothetical protein